MAKSITIKEIAEKAQVSIGTVDRVLHNRGRVANNTRERVLKIAKDGNYTSNVLARHLRLNKTYVIQVLLTRKNAYWSMLQDGIEQGCIEYESMGFTTQYYFQNFEEQEAWGADEKNEPINWDAEGFIIAPAVLNKNKDMLNRIKRTGKPYVFIDSNPKDAGQLSYIGQDAFSSGTLAAKLLYDKYIEDFQVFVITFEKAALHDTTALLRIEGFKTFFEKKNISNIKLINLEKDNLVPSDVHGLLKACKSPVHVFVPNSKIHLLANTLTSLCQMKQMRIVGYDLLPENLELLNSEVVDFLIHQKPQMQGYLSMQSLYKHIVLKKRVEPIQFMPLDIITKENVLYCQ